MKKYSQIACLLLAPTVAFAHEGVNPASLLHTFAHWSESYGLLLAIPVAVAVGLMLKRRRAAAKTSPAE